MDQKPEQASQSIAAPIKPDPSSEEPELSPKQKGFTPILVILAIILMVGGLTVTLQRSGLFEIVIPKIPLANQLNNFQLQNTVQKINEEASTSANLSPLYQLDNLTTKDRLLTTKQNEVDEAVNSGYINKGIIGYIYEDQNSVPKGIQAVPLHIFYNPDKGVHGYVPPNLYNPNSASSGFKDAGILGYAVADYDYSNFEEIYFFANNGTLYMGAEPDTSGIKDEFMTSPDRTRINNCSCAILKNRNPLPPTDIKDIKREASDPATASGPASPNPSPYPSVPVTGIIHISSTMINQTIHINVGSLIDLDYENDDLDWTNQFNTLVLQQVGKTQLQAIAPGTTDLQSTGRPCSPKKPPKPGVGCPQYLQLFNASLVVSK